MPYHNHRRAEDFASVTRLGKDEERSICQVCEHPKREQQRSQYLFPGSACWNGFIFINMLYFTKRTCITYFKLRRKNGL